MATIFIIDDEEALSELFASQIKLAGHTTTEFTDSREALAYLESHQPDLVVTDIRMPHVSGLEICKYVRNTYPDTGLVVVSGYSEIESDLYSMGGIVILGKPFRLDDLSEAVELTLAKIPRVKKAG